MVHMEDRRLFMKIKRLLITILLVACIIINYNYSYAASLTEPNNTVEAPTLYRIHQFIGALVTIAQTVLVIAFFVGLVRNCIKLSEANKEYNRLQNEEIDNKEEEIRKVEERIKDAKIRIMGVIIIALTIVCLYMIQDFFRVAKPIKPDRIN